MDPFSSLSMVNLRDGCKPLIAVSFCSICTLLIFCMMSSMYLASYNCFLFLFTLFVDFSFSILVDINRLVRIVQFMHTV